MPRILHVIGGLEVGGAEMALYRLVKSSCGSDYRHSVAVLTPDGAMRRRFHEDGVDLVTFDFKRAPVSQFLRLVSLIREARPDIVQTWLYHADLLGGLAARLAGNPRVIWGVHSTELPRAGTSRSARAARRLCAWASGFLPRAIVCAAEAARRAHAQAGYDPARMVVVPNGFEPARLMAAPQQRDALRAQCGFDPEHLVVGSLGRFNADKDPRNFVRAAGLLAQCHPQVRFLMVGRDLTPANAALGGWIAEAGCADRFVLLGERGDVPACLAAMDVFCLHSRTEAFPLALGEAMAAGLPCVATDVGDAALMLADAGAVVPREDPVRLAQSVERLLAMTDGQRRQLGGRARERICAEFTMDATRRRFEDLYRRVAEKAGR